MKVPKVVKVRLCGKVGCPNYIDCYHAMGIHPYPCVVRKRKFHAYRVLGKILVKENHENT